MYERAVQNIQHGSLSFHLLNQCRVACKMDSRVCLFRLYSEEYIIFSFARCLGLIYLTVQLLCWSSFTWSAGKIVFACSFDESSPDLLAVKRIYSEAFAALGYDFSMIYPPAGRGIAMLDSGLVDGDCGRNGKFIEMTGSHNLLRVLEPIRNVNVSVWTNSPNIKISTLTDINRKGVQVGYVRGLIGVRSILDSFGNIKKLSLNDTVTGLKMLSANRLNFFVGVDSNVRQGLRVMEFQNPIYLAGRLSRSNLYPYLNKEHAHMAKRLAKELKIINSRE